MYAFVSHASACDALRELSGDVPLWPAAKRMLPIRGDCITRQRDVKELLDAVEMSNLGIDETPLDLLVPSAGSRSRGRLARFHVWSRVVPANSFYRVHNNVLVSSPELVVVQLCGSQAKLEELIDDFGKSVFAQKEMMALVGMHEEPEVDDPLEWEGTRRLLGAVVVACEFAGTYRLPKEGKQPVYHAPKLMTKESLDTCARIVGSTSAESRARRAAKLAFDDSASPMETAVALMLTLPVAYGGFGLPAPKLNASPDIAEYRGTVSDRDEVRCDMLWEEDKVALEYDSYEFHGRDDLNRLTTDAVRSNILNALGYSTFRVTPGVIRSVASMQLLAQQLARALHVSLDSCTEIEAQRRVKLYTLLMPNRLEY